MPDYSNNRFKKPFQKSGPSRFGARDMGPKKMYKADCAKCGTVTEVPFRPNGMKPVYCRDCFVREERPEGRDTRDERPRFPKKDFGTRTYSPRDDRAERSERPAPAARPDARIDGLQRQLTNVEAKLDSLLSLVEEMTVVPAPKVAKAPAKKRATKKA